MNATIYIDLFWGLSLFLLAFVFSLIKTKHFILVLLAVRPSIDYFRFYGIGDERYTIINISAILTLFLLSVAVFAIMPHKISLPRNAISYIFLTFSCLTLLNTVLVSKNKLLGIADWLRVASLFSIYILVANLFQNHESRKKLILTCIISAIVPVFFGIYQYFTGTGSLGTPGYNRIIGTFVHPNVYGLYLAMLSLLILPWILQNRNTWLWSIFLVFNISLLLTYSRAIWAGYIAGLITIGLLRRNWYLILLLLVVLFIIIKFVPSVAERFITVNPFLSIQESSFASRINIWQRALMVFTKKLSVTSFFGLGLGSFFTYSPEVVGMQVEAHNDFLRMFFETGGIGLLMYLSLLFFVIRDIMRRYKFLKDSSVDLKNSSDRNILLSSIAIWVLFGLDSFFDNISTGLVVQWFFWTFVGSIQSIGCSQQSSMIDAKKMKETKQA